MPLPLTQEPYTLKSSTRNHPNPAFVADRRLEALVKKEMIEHQHIISCHNKEMQSLRDSLSLAMEKFKSISDKNDRDLHEFKSEANYQINLLKERSLANEAMIIEQRRMIEDLNQQIHDLYSTFAMKRELERLRSEFDGQFNYLIDSNINSFQDCQREIKTLVQSLQNELNKLAIEIHKKITELEDKGENNFSVSKIDRDGVLKELRVYKKDMFYIEKKIENIYTLIERINKRGESCHKQA